MHEGYIILSSYDIPELVVFIYMVLVDRGLMLTRKLLNQGFLVVKYFKNLIIANITWSRNICVTNKHEYALFVVIPVQSFPHSRLTT